MINSSVRFLCIVVVVLICACHVFDDRTSLETVQVRFNESNVSVFKGGMGSVSLVIDPLDAVANENVEWTVSNEDIAVVYRADKRGCVFYGVSPGSTVLSAAVKDAEAKMVITVLENEFD